MRCVEDLKVKISCGCGRKAGTPQMAASLKIKGLTTNPTLMRKAGVTDYRAFAVEILAGIREKPISSPGVSDEFNEMERQALEHRWLGRQCLREGPGHQHYTRACLCTNQEADGLQGQGKRYGHYYGRAGARHCVRRVRPFRASFCFRGPRCRHGPRPGAPDRRLRGERSGLCPLRK